MSNPLAVTLAASAERTASGTGTAADIGALRKAMRLAVVVKAVSAGATLTVEVQTSEDGATGWRSRGTFPAPSEPGRLDVAVAELARFVRLVWTIAGGTPAITFEATADAHVVYCEPRHLTSWGAQEAAWAEATPHEKADLCILVSSECDGYIARNHTLPLTAWPDELALYAAKIGVYHYLNGKGRQPMRGPEDPIDMGFKDATRWLKLLADDKIAPPGLVDSTPDVVEGAAAIEADDSRGWDDWR
jgi:phage gp36-like protein